MTRWLRRVVVAVACAVASVLAGLVASFGETIDLTLAQARFVARDAYVAGEFALAKALALRLLQANPRDAQALLILAAVEPQLGDAAAGRRAGRAAWDAAQAAPVELRYEIARHTAVAAFAEGRPWLAQLWLRRAADQAPSPDAYAQTVQDFNDLRQDMPLRFRLDLSVAPTSNVNNGADSGLLIIDDSFQVGPISASGQALAGMRTAVQAQLSYGLPATARSQTTLGLRGFAALHSLSATARRLAPDLSARDLDQVTVEASLGHDFLWPGSTTQPVGLMLSAGQSWQGGARAGQHLRLDLSTPVWANDTAAMQVRGSVERQWDAGTIVDAVSLSLAGDVSDTTGGAWGWDITALDVRGDARNASYQALSADLSYTLGRPIGPVSLGARLSAGLRDYDSFHLGGPLAVTRGRQDRHWGLAVDMTFPNAAVMGFAPRLSVSHDSTTSNVSRYDTQQLSVTLGIVSSF